MHGQKIFVVRCGDGMAIEKCEMQICFLISFQKPLVHPGHEQILISIKIVISLVMIFAACLRGAADVAPHPVPLPGREKG